MEHHGLKGLFAKFTNRGNVQDRRQRLRIRPPANTTVLIVDDSRTATFSIRQMLAQNGYRTLVAADGELGVGMAKEHLPDLILMDVVMPGLNGFQATRQIRQFPDTQHIPIIMISGNQQGTDQIWGSRLGANDFLAKPIDRGQFFNKIETLLNLHAEAV